MALMHILLFGKYEVKSGRIICGQNVEPGFGILLMAAIAQLHTSCFETGIAVMTVLAAVLFVLCDNVVFA